MLPLVLLNRKFKKYAFFCFFVYFFVPLYPDFQKLMYIRIKIMKHKRYQKPTITIVQLQQQQILAGSNGQATTQDYTWHEEVVEE